MDIILSSISSSTINIYSNLISQIKCINCNFKDNMVDIKLNCNRTARYQDHNNKIRCRMYLYKGK